MQVWQGNPSFQPKQAFKDINLLQVSNRNKQPSNFAFQEGIQPSYEWEIFQRLVIKKHISEWKASYEYKHSHSC